MTFKLSIINWFRSSLSSELEDVKMFLSVCLSYFIAAKVTAASISPKFGVIFGNFHLIRQKKDKKNDFWFWLSRHVVFLFPT